MRTTLWAVLASLATGPAHAQAPPDAPPPDAPPPDAAAPADATPPAEVTPPPIDLPPEPPPLPPPPPDVQPVLERPVFERPSEPSNLRHAFHLGMSFGLEVARDGTSAYAIGTGAHLGWELYWPSIGLELALAVQAHGDQTTTPSQGLWEAHPVAYLKLPFAGGVWEAFAGYGASPPSFHGGDLASDTTIHVAELGFEDRTKNWYSRLYVRWYLPFGGDLANPTAIVGATVGFFHLSRRRPPPP